MKYRDAKDGKAQLNSKANIKLPQLKYRVFNSVANINLGRKLLNRANELKRLGERGTAVSALRL